jgi:uncharacterized membrane protein YkoI
MLIAAVAASASSAGAAEARCWADWSDAALVVQREALRPAKEIAASIRARGKEVVRMTLCEERGRYIYRMVVVSGGRVENLTVDAGKSF